MEEIITNLPDGTIEVKTPIEEPYITTVYDPEEEMRKFNRLNDSLSMKQTELERAQAEVQRAQTEVDEAQQEADKQHLLLEKLNVL